MVAAALFTTLAMPAQAARVVQVSPQGEVSRVRQFTLRFDEAMVPLGNAQAAAPAALRCTGGPADGTGRWVDPRHWAFDFSRDLPPGMQCTVTMAPGLTSVAGTRYEGPASYRFGTGGPIVVASRPAGGEIDEDQIFALRFNGAVDAASLRQHAWCQAQGLGERIPVRLVEGADRDAVLGAIGWKARERAGQPPAVPAEAMQLLACQQRLPAGARMQLVLGAGIATPSGISSREARRFDYEVRQPLTARFSCERENAQAPCTPLRPLVLEFTAPVPRTVADAITLRTPGGSVTPRMDDGLSTDAPVTRLRFMPPFPPNASMTLHVPADLRDESGRALANADLFPLRVDTAAMPPLAKFAAAPFGVIERFAEIPKGRSPADHPPLLPVTLRHVESELAALGLHVQAGTVTRLRVDDDGAVLRWYSLVRRMQETRYSRAELNAILAGKAPSSVRVPPRAAQIDTRSVSLLADVPGVRRLAVPETAGADGAKGGNNPSTPMPSGGKRPFEVIGIPLPEPGFHVVEIASPDLGAALLGRKTAMYVRTAALVTNLGVHFKVGRDNALAWVTTLDGGKPVAGAAVAVRDCSGRPLAQARTDTQGIARFAALASPAPDEDYASAAGRYCEDTGLYGYFVSARIPADHPQARGQADMAFAMSDWNRGIESWRFQVPTDSSAAPTVRAHTVFDRTLVRAGETVSMKHFLRVETSAGFALPGPDRPLPDRLVIRHEGSGQTYEQPLAWRTAPGGGGSALSQLALPPQARLGRYTVELQDRRQRSLDGGAFRVESFRLPVLAGTVQAQPSGAGPLIAPKAVPLALDVHYVSGGGAAGLPVQVSALLRERSPQFSGYDGYTFAPPRPAPGDGTTQPADAGDEEQGEGDAGAAGQTLIADKRPVTLDGNGGGKLTLEPMPALPGPRELLVEAAFADPNGEIQTLRQTLPLWPAAVAVGIRADDWASVRQRAAVRAVTLDTAGKPRAGVPVEIHARARIVTSARKRVVGGFYRYDNRTEIRDLGKVCEGRSDAQGLVHCAVSLQQGGEVELIARARDDLQRVAEAATSVWVTGQGELWFGGENHDRIDLLPEQRAYAPGDIARFQVRMPFRHATALVAVEREGILETQVVTLGGKDPTVSLKVRPEWGPNVYVSVLALRGRLHDVPWYSFFSWGWREPAQWWRAFRSEGRDYVAPTPLVDLSKPAFRLGLAEIRVGNDAHRLDVKVTTDRPTYPVRGRATVTVQATLPDGKPAANGEIALAAVDEALLELMPNTSWNLLDAMLRRRSYGVQTSTAQMEIVGRRHYGRKAVPEGGGGGRSPTRELFDTLLLWNPRVPLDAEGRATVTVPLNDSLTRFRIVAVADLGVGRFGTGSATIAATQDLQVIAGLPPLVRENDRYRAMVTLRNATARPMIVEARARASGPEGTHPALPMQTVSLPAGQAREIGWDVTAPLLSEGDGANIDWELSATEKGGAATDRVRISQRLDAAVPLTVQQGTLSRLAPGLSVPVRAPEGALRGDAGAATGAAIGAIRGGVRVALQSSLAGGMPGVREWFLRYPYTCLEQRASKAVGLGDGAAWQALMAQLPSYQDDDGLVAYFPPQADGARGAGSEVLTAYLLALADEAERAGLRMALPREARERMQRGLIAFVEGRLQRRAWAPTQDLEVRKLAALEALSRAGLAQPRMLDSIQIRPAQWPTSALIDWTWLLTRLPSLPQRETRLSEAQRLLRARLDLQGTRLAFSTERDDRWWWLMAGGDVNAARLLSLSLDLPAWKDDAPRLATGLIGRQRGGAWEATNANALGTLAVRRFAGRFEKEAVGGTTQVELAGAAHGPQAPSREIAWDPAEKDAVHELMLPWPSGAQGSGSLQMRHDGAGAPWAAVRALAAVPLTQPVAAGYRIRRAVTPVEQAVPGRWSRGDIQRVRLDIDAQADMTWVVVSDPIPAGATILGGGLGRDSEIATRGEKRADARAWPAFSERLPQAYREYYAHLPKGPVTIEYTIRLNNAGEFALPPTRVEAMYAPEVFGAAPNARLVVGARP